MFLRIPYTTTILVTDQSNYRVFDINCSVQANSCSRVCDLVNEFYYIFYSFICVDRYICKDLPIRAKLHPNNIANKGFFAYYTIRTYPLLITCKIDTSAKIHFRFRWSEYLGVLRYVHTFSQTVFLRNTFIMKRSRAFFTTNKISSEDTLEAESNITVYSSLRFLSLLFGWFNGSIFKTFVVPERIQSWYLL